jgi:hypothetical protein
MATKKRKSNPRKPDLTFEVDSFVEFIDKPMSGPAICTPGVVTGYDPAVAALGGRVRKKPGSPKKGRSVANGHGKPGDKIIEETDRQRLRNLERLLDNCVNAAEAVQTKQAMKVVQLLRDAQTQIQRIHA